MQKTVIVLAVALARTLAYIVAFPNTVLGGVMTEPPALYPDISHRSAPPKMNISPHDVVLYAKVVGLEITVNEMKQYDLSQDGFISKEELDQFPMLLNLELIRNIEDFMMITLQDALTALNERRLNITLGTLDEYDLDHNGFLSVWEITKIPVDATPRRSVSGCQVGNRMISLKDLVRLITRISIHGKKYIQFTERDLIALDLNKDGIILETEFETLPKTGRSKEDPYSELIESKVTVSLEDAVNFLKEREYEVTVVDLKQFDLDHDGFLCFTEINKISPFWRPKGPPKDVVDSFKISLEHSVLLFQGLFLIDRDHRVVSQAPFDLNKDGFLSYQELKAIPKTSNVLSCGLFERDPDS